MCGVRVANKSRYLVGIDLGTTHTVVAYADSKAPEEPLQVFPLDQLVAPGEVAALPLLTSMRYHPTAGELADGDRVLPWLSDAHRDPIPEAIIGSLAQELGSKVPGRLVTSAKSWLSHPAVDRTAPVLPWGAPPDIPRISPLDASASYLRHVRHAWNHRFPNDPLEAQDIVLTVPASFDEVARRLTVEAARLGGLAQVRLVEEPQAACYDWLSRHADELDESLAGVRSLLVCDVGGGTTDLTLIRVDRTGSHPQLVRIGVGEHLMLGGDNMDLALAHLAERRLLSAGTQLGAAQLSQLVQQCRGAKERLLAQEPPKAATVTLLGTGARLIGQARSTELSREEVRQLVVDGFFPETASDERPRRRRAAGIVEFGLPYASDPAVTRHLAAFLADHAPAMRVGEDERDSPGIDSIVPDAVLLNGGIFRSEALAQRLLQALSSWRGEAPLQLHNDHPDLAVARGAVAYAMARRGHGARIGGGSSRSFLLLVEEQQRQRQRAVCLLPRGAEEGQELRLTDRVFSLRLGQPVHFGLVASSSERSFSPGELVEIDKDHFRTLPPLATILDGPANTDASMREVPVQLAATLTDIGTLEIDCVAADDAPADLNRRWRMEFQLRGRDARTAVATPSEPPASFQQAAERIQRVYGARVAGVGSKESKALQRDLEKLLGRRNTWDTHLLRALFGILWDGARRRRRSADHERLWFNLVGFCLRPGYGYPLDDWRAEQLWSIYEQGVQYRDEARNQAEWWTLWRRVAGGLDGTRQLHILKDIEGLLRVTGRRGTKGAKTAAFDDIVRLVAGLERLPSNRKAKLGELLLQAGRRPTDSPQRWWALGRLGARVPFYGTVHEVVSREDATAWLEQLLRIDWRSIEPAAFAATQLARLSGDRERDLDPSVRERLVERLRKEKASEKWISMVQAVTEIDGSEESLIFGESLPPGLRLVS
jgi:molecular chaperone DnaK (HSP70)